MIELIRYHLPTIVKHVLAPKNEFGTPKITWLIFKSFGIGEDIPPQKKSQNKENKEKTKKRTNKSKASQ